VLERPDLGLAVRVVETEAYLGVDDPAAHAFHGRTRRTEPLWGPPGTLYVYFIYGMHHCLNITCEQEGVPGCVLIRAAEPLPGGPLAPRAGRGPGLLCRALGLDLADSGTRLFTPGCRLVLHEGAPPARIEVTPRVGVTRAVEHLLRFFDPDSASVSGTRASRVGARKR
jgi:DNA-3-methyladenine glycosylase